MLPYCELVYWEESRCVSWSECLGSLVAFSSTYQWQMLMQHCCDSSSANRLFCKCFLFFCRQWSHLKCVVNVRWPCITQDYLSCIVLYPLQAGRHIISKTKQHWVTVVNSWQNKSRYKCGSCCICQTSTNRCPST